MNEVNKHVVVAAIVIAASGMIRVWSGAAPKGASTTKVIMGGYVVVIVLAGLDTFVPQMRDVVSALASLAMVTVILTSGLIGWVAGLGKTQPATGGGGGGPTTSH